MAESKHTPAPWQLIDGCGVAGRDGVALTDQGRPSVEILANLQLILAAPVLLKSARAVLDALDLDDKSGFTPAQAYALGLLRGALVKAEGYSDG